MEYAVQLKQITKRFPGVIANDCVNLSVRKGEIHALLGENGAGKSTLMSILFGLYQADEGEIWINEKEVQIKNPGDANRLGIGMVHQHFMLIHNFTVLENIILGVESVSRGFLKMDSSREKVQALSKQYGLNVDTEAYVEDISVGMQQRVEILKMLYKDNDILIFDEPTAVLTPQEIHDLMKILKKLAAEGKSIILITHKLNEIKEAADRCSVLRRGKYIGTVDVAKATMEELSEMMVGHKIELHLKKGEAHPAACALEVRDLVVKSRFSGKNLLNHVSLKAREGEITCIAGIEGNGQSELAYAIAGLLPVNGGQILLEGEDVTEKTVRYRNQKGIAHIPEDRQRYGLVLPFSLGENMVLKQYFMPEFQRHGFLRKAEMEKYAEQKIEEFDIRAGMGAQTPAGSMSGGNQQKAIIAREIGLDRKVLIAVQPTRGIDVGAAEYIHRQLLAQRDAGKAVLLISLELDEVMDISDRILVMYEGEIVGDLRPEEITVQELGLYMAGSKRGEMR